VQRSWRTVAAGGIGIFLFLMVIPAVVLGPEFNQECLASWWRRFVSPYAAGDVLTDQEVNQSLIGVLARLLTESRDPVYGRLLDRNLTSWPAGTVAALAKLMSIGLVGLMLWLTSGPPRRRDHSERLGEFALVALTMLMVSERSWKHHFVTLLLPHAYLTYRLAVSPADRGRIAAVLSAAAALMATTSSELGGLFAGGLGHKIALYHGGFFWAAALLFAATAWQLRAERRAAAHGFGWSAAATSTVKPGSSTELAVWPGTNVPCST
jgi:hypothetical protein